MVLRVVIVLLMLVALAAGEGNSPYRAPQQQHVDTPAASHDRRVAVFDFEERPRGNVESTPMHWRKMAGPGLPHYIRGELATDAAASGRYSFRFTLNGGSVIYRLDPQVLRVRDGAHYQATVRVRSRGLVASRVRMSAMLADDAGQIMPNSLVTSEPILANDGWTTLTVNFTADLPQADSIVLELGLLQPKFWSRAPLGDRTLYTPDIEGCAWFDDLVVEEVPRVSARFDHAAGLYLPGEPATLTAEVNDRYASELTPTVRIVDELGQQVYPPTLLKLQRESRDGVRSHATTRVTLPELPTGWYAAELNFHAGQEAVLTKRIPFVRLASPAASVPQAKADRRVTVDASALDWTAWQDLPEAITTLGARRVKLQVWPTGAAAGRADELSPLDRVLASLRDRGVHVTAALLTPPTELEIDALGWKAISQRSAPGWSPTIGYLLARHANHIDSWDVGRGDDAMQLSGDEDFLNAVSALTENFQRLAGASALAVMWPPSRDTTALPQGVRPRVVLTSYIRPELMPRYLSADMPLDIALLPPDLIALGPGEARDDLMRRAVAAMAHNPASMTYALPVEVLPNAAGGEPTLAPTPLLPTLHTLLNCLADARFIAALPCERGTTALLFERGGNGVAVIWSNGREATPARVALPVGSEASVVDTLGRALAIGKGGPGLSVAEIQPRTSPQIITGVNVQLTTIATSAAFDEPFMEADFKPQARTLRLTNRSGRAISLACRVVGPEGWTIEMPPRLVIRPNESRDVPVSIRFPYNADAGDVSLLLELRNDELPADQPLRVPLRLTLGLTDAETKVIAWREGPDLIIRQTVSNRSNQLITYIAFALVAGQARQERLVQDLPPGGSTEKTYRFKTGSARTARVGLRQLDGTRVLNHTAPLPPPAGQLTSASGG